MRTVLLITISSLALLVACGGSDVPLDGDGGNGNGDGGVVADADPNAPDADPNAPDAGPPGGCIVGGPECNNCIDDDSDGFIDGSDPHCVSSEDDDESSFATGIPGDNMDAIKQDCFFDGNSGAGDDGCDIHVCCLIAGPCPPDLSPGTFDPNECTPTQECIDNCAPITPPGCDCFGCCTVCNDANDCFDVVIHPDVSPDCDIDVLDDPALCPPCNQVEECSTPCEPNGCILCPGQTEDDLPPECNGNECPGDLTPCTDNTDCADGQFCSTGCCINAIP